MEKINLINLEALKATAVQESPFPYMIVSHALMPQELFKIQQDYPEINDAGSFPLASISYGVHFAQLIAELKSDAFRQVIAEKFAIALTDKPVMVTVRGKADHRDGRIHTDSESKLITVLLYMNEEWDSQEGQLRLLYDNKNLDHYFVEIPPSMGTMLIFKVTRNGWHGHKTFIGTRKVIQLNYVTNTAALNKHTLRHRISAKFKAWRHSLLGKKQHECTHC